MLNLWVLNKHECAWASACNGDCLFGHPSRHECSENESRRPWYIRRKKKERLIKWDRYLCVCMCVSACAGASLYNIGLIISMYFFYEAVGHIFNNHISTVAWLKIHFINWEVERRINSTVWTSLPFSSCQTCRSWFLELLKNIFCILLQ